MFPSPEETEITPAELQSLLLNDESPPFRLVDCREEDEYAFCRIEKGELIPLSRFAEEATTKLLGDENPVPVIVYCHHGVRSMSATMYLRGQGLPNTWSLAGGIDLWSAQIDPEVPRY
ncbi:MAG: rhodanese-like domain-containing protein [Verrucomicrobiales bacterium]|nr:rhodanese-like domain-containing protein [Verrucomicrobiales bacterium]